MSDKPAHWVRTEPHGEQGVDVRCVCGWRRAHPRAKVRNAAAAKHLAKHGVKS